MLRAAFAAAALCASAAAAFAPARAQQAPGLQISVEPLSVEFSLAPGGAAATPVTIKNVGTEKAVVVITPLDWRSGLDGTVRTERPGAEGDASLSSLLRMSAAETTLAPGETRKLELSLALPATFSAAPRDYRGGYLVRAVPASANRTNAFGVGANILVYETVGGAQRHLKMTDLSVVQDGPHGARMQARLLNDGRTFVHPQMHVMIAQGARIVLSRDDATPAILAGEPRRIDRTLGELAPGTYQLQLTVDYGGPALSRGTTTFTVR
ncbi:MAG TPA: hypothetical protein VK665_07855 [Candidatus Elarobacter sp.]|nr:hypothetical protein [Candidatus Elarobacter sp.]